MKSIKDRTCKPEDIRKPCCYGLECPYGSLVEEYPLHPEFEGNDLNALAESGELDTGYNCEDYGHDCPIYYSHQKSISKLQGILNNFQKCEEGLITILRNGTRVKKSEEPSN